jgi:hypothetical protein
MSHIRCRGLARPRYAIQLLTMSTLLMSGCKARESKVSTGTGAFSLGSARILSDVEAAGFSVRDPKVKWGVTIYVDAQQSSGGFSAHEREGVIVLQWNNVPDAQNYEILRSTKPVIPLLMETMLTLSTARNEWQDNNVVGGTRYYYAVLAAIGGGGCMVAATGSAAVPAAATLSASQTEYPTSHSTRTPTASPDASGAPGVNTYKDDFEADERRAERQRDGVEGVDMGQVASHAPAGVFGFAWSFDRSGDFLLYSLDEPDRGTHPFEIHKLSTGHYTLVGYVDRQTIRGLKDARANVPITVYARRCADAGDIVSLPFERLAPFAHADPVTVGGERCYVIRTYWKSSASAPDIDPSTQPITAGRHTPAEAMNVFARALQTDVPTESDVATVADSLYLPGDTDGSCRHAKALEYFYWFGLYRASEERFGPQGAAEAFHDFPGIAPQTYSAADFEIDAVQPNVAATTSRAQQKYGRLTLRRGDDEIWRIDWRADLARPVSGSEMQSLRNNAGLLERINHCIWAVKVGKYPTAEELRSDIRNIDEFSK